MRTTMTLAVAAFLSSAVLAVGNYKNVTEIAYDKDLPCANCIRAGYDFCLFGAQVANSTSR